MYVQTYAPVPTHLHRCDRPRPRRERGSRDPGRRNLRGQPSHRTRTATSARNVRLRINQFRSGRPDSCGRSRRHRGPCRPLLRASCPSHRRARGQISLTTLPGASGAHGVRRRQERPACHTRASWTSLDASIPEVKQTDSGKPGVHHPPRLAAIVGEQPGVAVLHVRRAPGDGNTLDAQPVTIVRARVRSSHTSTPRRSEHRDSGPSSFPDTANTTKSPYYLEPERYSHVPHQTRRTKDRPCSLHWANSLRR